jgi:putative peptidoglycan lipid II flippase
MPLDSPEPASNRAASATRQVGIVGLAVMASRVLGLARDLIIAALFGANRSLDAFLIAFRIPNLLRDLFAEGALSTAFVTVFSQKIATDGDDAAWTLASKVTTLVSVFMSAIVLLGILFADLLVRLQAPGFSADDVAFTTVLLRIMYPFILLVSLAALTMGMLNARRIFGVPAMASSFFNLGSIIGGVALGWWMDPGFGPRALLGLAMGTLLGGLCQLGVQLPTLFKQGFRLRFDWDTQDAGVRRIISLMIPAIIAGSAVQVNVVVNGIFASYQEGAISWLQYAFRLMQLPLGVFGVAVATVTLPLISRSAAVGNREEFREILARGIRLAFFLTIPSAIGLIGLAEPIIGLIFERGRFTHHATIETAAALRFYAIGLVGYAGIKVLAPAFYALDQRRTPMYVSLFSIVVNVALNAALAVGLGWGHRGLALSTSIVAMLNFGILYVLMRRSAGGLETGTFAHALMRIGIAAVGLAVFCVAAQVYLLPDFFSWSLATRIFGLLGVIAVAGGLFFASCYLLRVPEMHEVTDLLRRRVRGEK